MLDMNDINLTNEEKAAFLSCQAEIMKNQKELLKDISGNFAHSPLYNMIDLKTGELKADIDVGLFVSALAEQDETEGGEHND